MPRTVPRRTTILLVATTATVSTGRVAEAAPERPTLPAYTIAGDDGAGAIWRNPANFAMDPDESWFVGFNQTIEADAPASLAAATHQGPLGLGLAYRYIPGPGEPTTWTTLSTGLALKLDRNLAMGAHLGWQVPGGPDNNFVTWDLGLTWRPASWIGLGAVAQNIGDPEPGMGVEERYGPGLVVRPFGDRVVLGADYLFTGVAGSAPDGRLEGSLQVRPADGITLRGYADQAGTFGGGLEVYFGRGGIGAHARVPGDGGVPDVAVYGTSALPERRISPVGRRVAVFELRDDYPYQPTSGLFAREGEAYLHLVERMREASEDPVTRGILLELGTSPFSLAQVEEIRRVMARARENGKPVVVYLDESSSNAAYFLACAADQVYLHPAATLDVIGLSAELQFYRGTLDLIGVEPEYARRSEYKSGLEPMMRTEGSEPYREQTDALLDDLSSSWIEGIATARGRTPEEVQALVDGGPYTADEALEKGLVDRLVYPDQLDDVLEDTFPRHFNADDEYRVPDASEGWPARHAIALVYVEGPIVTGWSEPPGLLSGRVTGSRSVVEQLGRARRDDNVKAVVMRVDSPGGSSFASDEIWRAVERVKDKGKPVIVSMGGVAASGGYYVAAGADAIYAEPTTITGSIGVYAGKYSLAGLYDKLGVNTEIYSRGRNAAMWSSSKPMDELEYAAMDRMVGDTYELFKRRVAAGRSLSTEQVEEIARGRVWSGKAARQVGLVDELGSFHDAVDRAREEAGLPRRAETALVVYGDRPGPDGELSQRTVEALWRALLPGRGGLELPEPLETLQQERALGDDRVWAIIPYRIEVR